MAKIIGPIIGIILLVLVGIISTKIIIGILPLFLRVVFSLLSIIVVLLIVLLIKNGLKK
jgi:hypothetical protein